MNKIQSLIRSRPVALLVTVIGLGLLLSFAVSSQAEPAGISAPDARKAVPDFTVRTLDGAPWSLAAHKGEVVLVNLFATWCPPCRAEMPGLVETINAYQPKGVAALALSLDQGGLDVVRPFAAKYKMNFPVAVPGEGPSIADGVSSIPVTVLIDRSGRIAQTYVGMVRETELKRDLDQLLQEQK